MSSNASKTTFGASSEHVHFGVLWILGSTISQKMKDHTFKNGEKIEKKIRNLKKLLLLSHNITNKQTCAQQFWNPKIHILKYYYKYSPS